MANINESDHSMKCRMKGNTGYRNMQMDNKPTFPWNSVEKKGRLILLLYSSFFTLTNLFFKNKIYIKKNFYITDIIKSMEYIKEV